MYLGKEAFEQIQERAHRQLSIDFARQTIAIARNKIAIRRNVALMTITAVMCSAVIYSYAFINTAITQKSNQKSLNEQTEMVELIENAY